MLISKPGASIRTHLFVAASIWSVVGIVLLLRGADFLASAEGLWLLVPAIVIGSLKSRFLLDKSAQKNLIRLDQMKDGACLGGVYSVKMWVMIAVMVFLGRTLRSSGLPGEFIGILYAAVGWGLFCSSRLFWKRLKCKDC